MISRLLNLLFVSGFVLALMAALPVNELYAQHQGLLVSPDSAQGYQKISQIEQELYGHTYWNQSYGERIERLERTLFGGKQHGAQDARVGRLAQKMQEKSNASFMQNQEPMLVYLEEKLFQRSFDNQPLPSRVQQLESHVFGRTFENYPLEVRLKKLTYAIPIVAKEIRVAKDGIVIASTARKSPRSTARSNAPPPEMTLLDASTENMITPAGLSLSTGDYFQSIHKQPNGQMVRWSKLPIRVYVKPTQPKFNTVADQAIGVWKQSFSVETVTTMPEADVVIDWDTAPSGDGTLTRPFVHMGEGRKIRTVILISMQPFKALSSASQLNGLAHQLGHAFGLWGHSDNPNDIMYPSQREILKDMPVRWARRSMAAMLRPSAEQPGDFAMMRLKPSQRDINTLLRIYDEPALDLSTYNPYFQ